MHESKENIKSISRSPWALKSSLCSGLKQSNPHALLYSQTKKKKKEEGLFFLLWSSQNLRVFSPKRIKACMYVSAAFVFLPCVPLSAFLGPPAKSPQIPNATPKAWALFLSSFYHRTLLALTTLLYLWQEFLSKAPHCISNTSDSPLHYPRLTHRRTRNAAVSCPNTVCNPPKNKIKSSPASLSHPHPKLTPPQPLVVEENNILCIPQQPTHSKRLMKDIPNVSCCQALVRAVRGPCVPAFKCTFTRSMLYTLN